MKVRELRLRHFRNVGAQLRTISFADEATGLVRPLTVLVGSNGSGKSSVLEVIEGLLSFMITRDSLEREPLLIQELHDGYAAIRTEFSETAPDDLPKDLWIVVGRVPPEGINVLSPQIAFFTDPRFGWIGEDERKTLARWVTRMLSGEQPLVDGLLHFPHNRWIDHKQRGAIEPPSQPPQWLFRFEPMSQWSGSLSQLWVWQNYLDLEQQAEGRPRLTPFVQIIEEILGDQQHIRIREGQVRIVRPHLGDEVEPHQLPSGQQQVLTLFGELARRLRPGAVIFIDEIELSLHPALQRAVLSHLRRLAREYDLQIVVTTHSMEIVANVAEHEVVNLDDMVLEERARAREAQA
jgi:energy-coupling factor transporter ATP-binding protein EcfA2